MNQNNIEYGPSVRKGHSFGYGSYYSRNLMDDSEEAARAKALRLGWSNGCPRAKALTSPSSEYSLDWMINRYSETNFWFRRAIVMSQTINPTVHLSLITPRPRQLPDEPVGLHEPTSVPKLHLKRISPMSGINGYATPRLLIEIMRLKGEDQTLSILKDALYHTGSMWDTFLARLTNNAILIGVDPIIAFHHVYSKGILVEENCVKTFSELAKDLEKYAIIAWREYLNLDETNKSKYDIADVPA